jgi:hypothetical protein
MQLRHFRFGRCIRKGKKLKKLYGKTVWWMSLKEDDPRTFFWIFFKFLWRKNKKLLKKGEMNGSPTPFCKNFSFFLLLKCKML